MPWFDVADRAALADRRWLEAEAGRTAILLYDIDGQVFATSAICPHHAAWLSQGGLGTGPEGPHVDCPRHQGRFLIQTGALIRGPACPPLKTYRTKVQADRVMVET